MKKVTDTVLVLDGVTTGTSIAIPVQGCTSIGCSVVATGTVSAGQVTVETAPTNNYSGTWASALTVTPATNTNVVNAAGIVADFARARLTINVTGGATVKVYIHRHYD